MSIYGCIYATKLTQKHKWMENFLFKHAKVKKSITNKNRFMVPRLAQNWLVKLLVAFFQTRWNKLELVLENYQCLHMATNPAVSLDKVDTVLWRRGTCFLWMRWALNSAKSIFFPNQYKFLDIQKCYSMALMFTFDIPLCPGTYTDSRIYVEVEKCHFSSLQNILNCQAEYALKSKTNISVGKFNECLIE